MMLEMGFSEEKGRLCLLIKNGDIEAAVELGFTHEEDALKQMWETERARQ